MLSYRDYQWVLLHGPSRFEAHIDAGMRRAEEVRWELVLQYVAGGPQWRRVVQHERPSVELQVGCFHLPGRKWTSLEEMNYWNKQREGPGGWVDLLLNLGRGGCFDLLYHESPESEPEMVSLMSGFDWRVVERDGARFTVELAAAADGKWLWEPPKKEEQVLVLEDGTEEVQRAPEDESWKERAEVYAMEEVPFGRVTVKVPRNAGDAATFAQARARTLLGVTQAPEDVKVLDFAGSEKEHPGISDELHVHLHYHGVFEDY